MKTISQYKEDIAALMKKASDIDSQCEIENREPTSAELTIKNEILDTVDEYRAVVKTMERQERMREAIEKPHDPATLENKKPKGSGIQVADKDKFNSFGEQLAAVMRAGMPGGSVDKRLTVKNAATGLNETVSSDGGFLVQQDYSAELLKEVINTGVLAQRCRRIPISANSNGIKIPGVDETSRASTRSGGVVAYWKDEAALKTASRPKFRMIELSLKKLIGLCYATDELLGDGPALEAFVKMAFVDEFGFQIDDAIINGTGAGMPLGVLNAGSLVTVSKETGQAAATLVTENIVKMYSRRFASKTNNYIWFYNQSIEPQLMTMSVSVGTGGGPVYMPPGGLNSAPYGMLLGRPAIAIEQAAALGTIGDIMFCDFSDGYLLAEKGGLKTDMSIHVQFLYDESVFRFVLRIDGQPVRASALTPYKGGSGATQSHFIALETRS